MAGVTVATRPMAKPLSIAQNAPGLVTFFQNMPAITGKNMGTPVSMVKYISRLLRVLF